MENSSLPKRARRSLNNLLIEPFKQVRFGIYMLVISLCFTGVCSLILMNSFLEQYRHVLSIFNVVDPHLRWEFIADEVFYANFFRLGLCFLVFLIVLFSTIIKLTHRFYGPIVAFNRLIEELKRGNYSARVTLRKNDELQSLAKSLNSLAETLEKRR